MSPKVNLRSDTYPQSLESTFKICILYCVSLKIYKSTVSPLLSPNWGPSYLFQALLSDGGAYLKGGGGGRGLFNWEKTMVSVLHKEVEYKVEKLKYKKVGGYVSEIPVVNKPFWNFLGHQLWAT